jgi:deoxyribonuclease-4
VIVGVHCPVYHGLKQALERAVSLECEAMQVLPYRRHHPPSPNECAEFDKARRASKISRLFIHSRFVPNLASSEEATRARSVAHLISELKLARALGGEAYVLHGGAYSVGSSFEEGLRFFQDGVKRALEEAGGGTILVENVPGGGRRMGGTLEELAKMVAACPDAGACLDTAHAWAAGYDVASAEGALKFLAKANRLIGADNVKLFHLNDTRSLSGSNRENHAHWGAGFLGKEGLKTILDRSDFAHAVGIVEPPLGALEDDRASLAYVRRLA